MKRTHRTCHLCEAMCGLIIEHDGEVIRSIRGDADDPLSRGHICPKAVALQDLQSDPDWLEQPMRRTEGGWEPLEWTEAFDLVARELTRIRSEHGANAIGIYQGNPSIHSLGTMLYGPPFVRSLGTRSRFSATSVDQLPHQVVARELFGHQLLLPVPDVDHTDLLVFFGHNPLVSNGSLMTAPDIKRRLRAVQERGGELVVADPRRTRTADMADCYLPIRPGSDAAMLAAMLHVLFAEDLVAVGRLAPHVDGLDALETLVAPFAPETVAAFTGVSADQVRALTRRFAQAERAVIHGRMGVSTQAFGALCIWFIHLLNLLTGNLDRQGGSMFTTPAVDIVPRYSPGSFGRWKSRVSGLPEANGELPAGVLTEEIREPGPGQLRALVTSAGNPVLSTPGGSALSEALEGLDFMVSVDPYINETTRHAHVILPPARPLYRDHYDLVFHALAVRNTARFSPSLFERPDHTRHDWEIFDELTKRLQAKAPISRRLGQSVLRRLGPRGQLAIALRLGPYGRPGAGNLGLRKLLDAPSGIDLGPLTEQLPKRLWRRSRIPLVTPLLTSDVPRLARAIEAPRPELVLIGRRHLRSCNSWLHNAERLVKGPDRCTLLIHPDDAGRRGLRTGDTAKLTTRTGSLEAPVEVSDEVMPGVVSLPHGWGHGREGVRLGVASAHPGVSMNDVTDPHAIDALIGTAVLNGVPVEVS